MFIVGGKVVWGAGPFAAEDDSAPPPAMPDWSPVRRFGGYAGWGDGQIESEILANGWIHCDPDPDLIFDTDYDAKWETAIGKLGAGISGLSADAGRA